MITDEILAVDIGGTNIRVGLVDPDLSLRHMTMEPSVELLEVADPSQSLLEHLKNYLNQYGGEVNARPRAVSIGFPATIDKSRRVVLSTSNIRSMQNLAIVDFLEEHLEVPVVIDCDVNMLMRFDIHHHDVGDEGVVIGCYVGTGFGNSISINGRIHLGAHGAAGELGHLPMVGLTRQCGCGNIGCIETVASGLYLREIAQEHFPQTPIGDIFLHHASHPVIQEYLGYLAIPVASEINILDPLAVILGGGVLHAPGFPLPDLEREIIARTRKPYPANDVKFLYSKAG